MAAIQCGSVHAEARRSGATLTTNGLCADVSAGDNAENDCGLTSFDGSGGITSTLDVNVSGRLHRFDFNGTYTVAPNGRGTLIFSSPAGGEAVFGVISPTEILSTGAIAADPINVGTC